MKKRLSGIQIINRARFHSQELEKVKAEQEAGAKKKDKKGKKKGKSAGGTGAGADEEEEAKESIFEVDEAGNTTAAPPGSPTAKV